MADEPVPCTVNAPVSTYCSRAAPRQAIAAARMPTLAAQPPWLTSHNALRPKWSTVAVARTVKLRLRRPRDSVAATGDVMPAVWKMAAE